MRCLNLVEILDFLFQKMPDSGAQDMTGRMVARVEQALLGIDILRDLVSGAKNGRRVGEAAEMQDLALGDGAQTHHLHVKAGSGVAHHDAHIRRLAAALGVEDGGVGDDDVVFIPGLLEQASVGLFERCDGLERRDGDLKRRQVAVALKGQVGALHCDALWVCGIGTGDWGRCPNACVRDRGQFGQLRVARFGVSKITQASGPAPPSHSISLNLTSQERQRAA